MIYTIIFVIFIKEFLIEQEMMFDANFDSLDERTILQQLNRLDTRLVSKKNIIATDRSRIIQQRFSSFSKQGDQDQYQPLFPPLPNNFQYFSQINNKEIEDSMFDQSLIGHHAKSKQLSSYSANSCALRESRESKDVFKKTKSTMLQNTLSRDLVLKEQEYIFKKQSSQNHPSFKKKINANKNTNNLKSQVSIQKNNKTKQLKSKEQKYQPNLHHYLNCNYSSNDLQAEQKIRDKMKTQQCVNSYENIEDYLLRLSSSQIAHKNQKQSKSSSRIKCKNTLISEGKEKSLDCTFKPKILERSRQLAKNSKNVIQRLATLDRPKIQKMPYQPLKQNNPKPSFQRIDQLSQPRKLKIADPSDVQQLPSFKPNLSKKSLEHMSNCTYDVATRNRLWLQQKQEKIQKMRQEEEQERKRKQQASHSPAIKVYKGQSDVQFSRFGKEGMVNYFQRLSLLKKRPSKSNLNKNDTINSRFPEDSQHNKQNEFHNLSKQRSFTNIQNKSKNQTYSQAVKNLHTKIMNLKI